MFGYACDDTEELMPAPIMYAHKLAMELAHARKSCDLPFLRPDGKTLVTARYRDGRFVDIATVLISAQHAEETPYSKIREALIERVIKKTIPERLRAPKIEYLINPTGKFVQGGPKADCGLTGRKIIVDTYGGMGRHGGGAFSGKDPTKVDRSAAYAARHAAKNVVAAGLAERCEIQIAYAIGVAEPVSVDVNAFGTGAVSEEKIAAAVQDVSDFTPDGIIERLQLRRPIYKQTSAYGHFGAERDRLYLGKDRLCGAAERTGARHERRYTRHRAGGRGTQTDRMGGSGDAGSAPHTRAFSKRTTAQRCTHCGVPSCDHRNGEPDTDASSGRRAGGAVRVQSA